MKKETFASILSYLKWKRDATADLIQKDLRGIPNYKEIIGHFNNEINIVQFLIDNLFDKKTIQDNPYVYPWLESSIIHNYQNRGIMYNDLNDLMIYLYDKDVLKTEVLK